MRKKNYKSIKSPDFLKNKVLKIYIFYENKITVHTIKRCNFPNEKSCFLKIK